MTYVNILKRIVKETKMKKINWDAVMPCIIIVALFGVLPVTLAFIITY